MAAAGCLYFSAFFPLRSFVNYLLLVGPDVTSWTFFASNVKKKKQRKNSLVDGRNLVEIRKFQSKVFQPSRTNLNSLSLTFFLLPSLLGCFFKRNSVRCRVNCWKSLRVVGEQEKSYKLTEKELDRSLLHATHKE